MGATLGAHGVDVGRLAASVDDANPMSSAIFQIRLAFVFAIAAPVASSCSPVSAKLLGWATTTAEHAPSRPIH